MIMEVSLFVVAVAWLQVLLPLGQGKHRVIVFLGKESSLHLSWHVTGRKQVDRHKHV